MLINEISMLLKGILAYQNGIFEKLIITLDINGILMKGILYKNSPFCRDIIQQFIYFLSANIRPINTPVAKMPLGYFLQAFLDTKLLLSLTSDCESLYELLILLIDQYKPLENKGEKLINTDEKLQEILIYLKIYESKEVSQNSPVDNLLLGLLQLAAKLVSIKDYTLSLTITERIELIKDIFYGCLFPDNTNTYKCKTNKTREIAYKLVHALAAYKTECCIYLMRDCIMPLREKVSELTTWSYNPNSHERSALGYAGLKNIGCICYINSMLQQFFMIPPFRNAIASVSDGIPQKLNEENIDDNLLHQLQRTFVYLIQTTRKDYNPAQFCYSFKETDGKPTNTAIQHDAQEFLNILFDRLEKILKNTPYKHLTQSLFSGKSNSQVICSNCGYVSSTYEDYYTLSLEIKNQRTLQDCLEKYISGANVSEYMCSSCKKKVDVVKRTLISTLPSVLIVHLQRFTFNFDTLMNEKIHTRLEFPNTLDMSDYTEEGFENKDKQNEGKPEELKLIKEKSLGSEQKTEVTDIASLERKRSQIEDQEKEEKEKNSSEPTKNVAKKIKKTMKSKDYYQYKLVGVLVHNGNAESGHYYSFINSNRIENENQENYFLTENDKWLSFDDSHISEFTFSKMEAECFGGTLDDISNGYMDENTEMARLIGKRSKSAYMLVYERKYKDLIPLKVEQKPLETDIVLSSLDCDGTAVSRAQKTNSRIFSQLKDETYLFHQFHHIPLSIPHDILSVFLLIFANLFKIGSIKRQ